MTPESGLRRASESLPRTPVRPVVIKIGGRSLEAPGAPEELAAEVASLSGAALLVHGGGRELSDWCARLGIESRFVDGLRVTDPATLEVAVAVLAGLANQRLVALLRARGIDAFGLSVLDAGMVVAPHERAAELGAVGRIVDARSPLLESAIAAGRTPVLSSIGGRDGALLNLNADDVAAAVAAALGTSTLLLLSDAPGVQIGGEIVEAIPSGALPGVLAHPDVQGGMTAKLNAARAALERGVETVRIAAWRGRGTLRALLESGAGATTLHAAAEVSS